MTVSLDAVQPQEFSITKPQAGTQSFKRRKPEPLRGFMRVYASYVLTVCGAFSLLPLTSAYAGCANPAGEEGVMVYNVTHKTMQFCNGAHWIAMGGSIAPGGPKTMYEGWPDAIRCTIHNQHYDVDDTLTFHAAYMPYGQGGLFYYRAIEDVSRKYFNNTATVTQIGFNSDKTFNTFGSSRRYQDNPDLVYLDAGSCQGKSIADLYAEGKAFNFVGYGP